MCIRDRYVSAHPDEANMVFLEVELEGGFGIEAGKKVLQMQPDSQLIFISAKDTYYPVSYTHLSRIGLMKSTNKVTFITFRGRFVTM